MSHFPIAAQRIKFAFPEAAVSCLILCTTVPDTGNPEPSKICNHVCILSKMFTLKNKAENCCTHFSVMHVGVFTFKRLCICSIFKGYFYMSIYLTFCKSTRTLDRCSRMKAQTVSMLGQPRHSALQTFYLEDHLEFGLDRPQWLAVYYH